MLAWILVGVLFLVLLHLVTELAKKNEEYQVLQQAHRALQHELAQKNEKNQALQQEDQGLQQEHESRPYPTAPLPRYPGRRDISQQEFQARLEELGFETYEQYLRSDSWLKTRRRYFSSHYPKRCLVCEAADVDLHHRTYERLGQEELFDLVPLCRDHHERLHELLDPDPELCVKDTHDYLVLLRDKGRAGGKVNGKEKRRPQKIGEYKDLFRSLSTEDICHRLNKFAGVLDKEAVVALRELLQERVRPKVSGNDPGREKGRESIPDE